MLIDPRHLEQLAVIIDAGTLQEAAKQIGTSQPSLSRMISNLETRIGVRLFERTSRPIKPTAMGIELANQGRAITTARRRAVEFIDLGARGFVGVLKIGAPPFLCERLVSEAIASFAANRPSIRTELVPDYLTGLQERLSQNQIDVIVAPAKFADAPYPDLSIEPLFEDVNVIVGRSMHPLIREGQLSARHLENATWIGHSDRSMLRYDMEAALKLMGVRKLHLAFQSESAGAVIELLKSTDHLTILPRYALRPDGNDGLAVIKAGLPNSERVVSMVTIADREETRLTSDFKAHLRRYVETRP